ncbi:MFS transporter [Aspergillus clavatus NRRL 1]|uniref:MFS multidrug transporter, putative n=1 Tax=Aspergillus clavatus (strain ATCC 1007 / CBS 513.65 / DSM 816 / NCTC 3887 / NRRL 1 / QM 1276 / 107) TaxID=344612 RepID=A1CCZ4_ASPCL|nr:MFS multidrug transporter, putative [Aspergillus clavatus NRRL 1]EAW12401.1 MFS multidrug transporter, putative [Aspergillus clavatus NRRL 1]
MDHGKPQGWSTSSSDLEKNVIFHEHQTADAVTQRDASNTVDWDGRDDPARPINWNGRKKWVNVASVAMLTFLTPLASSMVAPAQALVMDSFDITSDTLGSFVISIYLVGFAVGPLVLGPLSEIYGRLRIYQMCNVVFIIWNIACAVTPNVGSLLAFRLFAGLAGSCPLTLGAGSIADLFIAEERGAAMSVWSMGPLMGPVVGPIAGGYLSEAVGWRWIFWVIAMAAGGVFAFSVLFQTESYEPVLLQQRVDRLSKETGNAELRSKLAPNIRPRENFIRSIVRPTKMLLLSPIVLLFSIYIAMGYGYLYLLFTTITSVFMTNYHFSQGAAGLTYLGIGIGSLVGLLVFGSVSDRILIYLTKRNNGVAEPEFRMPPLIPGSLFVPIGLFWYGWSVERQLHWMIPIIGTGFVGFGILAAFLSTQTYLVDAFSEHAASVTASMTVIRSLAGAFLPLAGPAMYARLGLGWGNSMLGFIALAMWPLPVFFFCYGKRIRALPLFNVTF